MKPPAVVFCQCEHRNHVGQCVGAPLYHLRTMHGLFMVCKYCFAEGHMQERHDSLMNSLTGLTLQINDAAHKMNIQLNQTPELSSYLANLVQAVLTTVESIHRELDSIRENMQ